MKFDLKLPIGTKVRFLNENGWPGQSSSTFTFEETGNREFNTVMFEQVQ